MKNIGLSLSSWFVAIALVITLSSTAYSGEYAVDVSHSNVGFAITHLMISKVKGQFNEFKGGVDINEGTKEISNVWADIKTESIDTNNQKRDEHLKSPDFFNVSKYPEIRFKSTSTKKLPGNKYKVEGDLTMKGVTKKITLTGEMLGMIQSKTMGTRAGFRAEATINRHDFGVSWDKTMDIGGVVVGNEVMLIIETEVIKKK